MVSVNLIFHVASALTFAALIWALLRLQSQIAFLRELLRTASRGQEKLRVDWPDTFLKNFAEALGLPFEGGGARMNPCKLDLKVWMEAYQALGIEGIRWAFPKCTLTIRRRVDLDSWRGKLEASLHNKVVIEWAEAPSK